MVRVVTSSVSSDGVIYASPLRNSQKKACGLGSGDLKGHSLMSFAVLSRSGEQDLCCILQLLHNLQSVCEDMKIVQNDLRKNFFKNIT
jgi:hypothetical protein